MAYHGVKTENIFSLNITAMNDLNYNLSQRLATIEHISTRVILWPVQRAVGTLKLMNIVKSKETADDETVWR